MNEFMKFEGFIEEIVVFFEVYICKYGLVEIINVFFMSYKFRKKVVCDFMDNLYY